MMAHAPRYLEQYCRLGRAIRHEGELDPVVRELAITRTGILCEAPYEIVAHKRIGKNVGVYRRAECGAGELAGGQLLQRIAARSACLYRRDRPAAPPERCDFKRYCRQVDSRGT